MLLVALTDVRLVCRLGYALYWQTSPKFVCALTKAYPLSTHCLPNVHPIFDQCPTNICSHGQNIRLGRCVLEELSCIYNVPSEVLH